MGYTFPRGLLAGFYAEAIAPGVPELHHAGEQWAPREFFIFSHTHTVWEFYLQVSGETRWEADGRTYTLLEGHFFAVAPQIQHHMREHPVSKHHFYFAAIDLKALVKDEPEIAGVWEDDTVVCIPQGETLAAPFRQLIREVALCLPYRERGLRLALHALVLEASRLRETVPQEASPVFRHPAVLHAKELLEHQVSHNWRLEDLSRMVGLSTTHLAECFTREVGVPPHQYLLQLRVDRAKAWLQESNIGITEMALELGFASGQHFTATFKRLTGKTPRTYRARVGGVDE